MTIIVLLIIIVWNVVIIINKKRKVTEIKVIKKFNLGNSYSLCAFENSLKTNTNLAENSQTLYYDYKILNHYFDKIEKEAICFLSISYFSFNSKEYWLETDLIKYYKILKIRDFKGKARIFYTIYKYFPILWSILKKFFKEKKYDTEKRIKGHVKKLEEGRNLAYNLEILESIILKCKEKSIRVIFLATPFTKKYNDYFSEDLLKEKFYPNIDKMIKKYNISYLDFSHDYINFSEKDFKDADHLSLEGSKKFVDILLKNLENKNVMK